MIFSFNAPPKPPDLKRSLAEDGASVFFAKQWLKPFFDNKESLKLHQIQNEITTWIEGVRAHHGHVEPKSLEAKLERLLARYTAHHMESTSLPVGGLVDEKKVTKGPLPSKSARITSIFAPPVQPLEIPLEPLPREMDAFFLKVITLLKKQEETYPPREIMVRLKRSTPSLSAIPLDENFPHGPQKVTLWQSVELFPGEKHKIYGSFRRPSPICDTTIPLPESFHIVTDSQQTAFPKPSQHTGWAANEKWLSQEKAESDSALYEQKGRVAKELLPSGKYLPFAKKLLQLKREAFCREKEAFLKLHERLVRAFFDKAKLEEDGRVAPFFEYLRGHPTPYFELTEAYLASYEEKKEGELPFVPAIRSLWLQEGLKGWLEDLAMGQLRAFLHEMEEQQVPVALAKVMLGAMEQDLALLQS